MSYLKQDGNGNDEQTNRRDTWENTTPQARAARATYLLMRYGPMTTEELMRQLGYKQRASVEMLMNNLSIGEVPVQEGDGDYWVIEGDTRYVFD